MEGRLLPGDTVAGEDAVILRGAFSDDGNQLQLPAHPQREDAHVLVRDYTENISLLSQGAPRHYSLPPIARLRRCAGQIRRCAQYAPEKTGSPALSVAAVFETRHGIADRFS